MAAYLRPSNQDQAKHSGAILKLLVSRLRKKWPHEKVIFRGDSGLCRYKVMDWCDRNEVNYVLGIGKNNVLMRLAKDWIDQAERQFKESREKQRLFGEFEYRAQTWNRRRHVVVKAERLLKGPNTRFIVTNLPEDAQRLYDKIYCARGEMENRIKEQQLDLFADRTSCHRWWSNQLRMLFSALASVLLITIRNKALKNTEFARATCGTIRLKLLKIGTVIVSNTRKVRYLLSSAFPHQSLFFHAARVLSPD